MSEPCPSDRCAVCGAPTELGKSACTAHRRRPDLDADLAELVRALAEVPPAPRPNTILLHPAVYAEHERWWAEEVRASLVWWRGALRELRLAGWSARRFPRDLGRRLGLLPCYDDCDACGGSGETYPAGREPAECRRCFGSGEVPAWRGPLAFLARPERRR